MHSHGLKPQPPFVPFKVETCGIHITNVGTNIKNPKPTFRIQTRASVSLGKLPGRDEHQLSLKRTKLHTANCSTRYSTGQTFETAYSRNKGICENSFKADKQHVSTARGLSKSLNPAGKGNSKKNWKFCNRCAAELTKPKASLTSLAVKNLTSVLETKQDVVQSRKSVPIP